MQTFKTILRYAYASVVLAALAAGSAIAQDLNAKLPTDPSVTTGKLSNGLTYYIRPNHKPENKVELRLVVKAGSILEDNDQRGLAHFMEHMNFNGTKNFQKNELVNYLQSIGVEFGADLNAYTSFDETVYILPIPTDKKGNLEKGFQIIEDWAHNALLTDKDIDEERKVVLEESRLGKGADMRMLDKYFPKLAEGTLYADRLPIGKDDILKNFKYETIRRYYKDWYRPDLQAVVVVGDIDVATARTMIEQHFGNLQNPASEKPRNYVAVTQRAQPEAMVVTDKEATNSILQILFPYTRKHVSTTLGDYRQDVVRSLALQIINQRLSDLAQSGNPPFPFAGVGFNDMIHGYEAFSAYTMFGNDGPEKAMNAIAAELLRAEQFGFTQNELERAKKEVMSSVEKSYNERTTTNSGAYVSEYVRAFLDSEPIPGIANEYGYYQALMPGIQVTELNAMAKEWMRNNNTFTLITGPANGSVKLPTDAALLAMTKTSFAQQVKANEETVVTGSLLSATPTPGKVVSQKVEDGLGAVTYTLSNGVKVTLKPTDFKSDEILLKGVKKGGANSYGVADKSNVNFATDIVDAMGLGNFSPTDLEKVLAGKYVSVTESIDEINDNVSGNSNIKDFETMMQVVYLQLTQPRKDEGLFNAYKEKQKMMVQFMMANPQASFFDTTVKTMYNNNPLRKIVIPSAQDYDNITLDRALTIYKNEFGNANGFHFFIVGNVTAETAIPLIERYLGSLPAGNDAATYKDNGLRPITGDHTIKVKKGSEKKSMIFTNYYGEKPYSEDFSLRAQAVAEVLNIKVIEEMREKMGGIYGGGFYANVTKEPYAHYNVILQLPCGPENVDKLLAAANTEIKALAANGPSATDLEKVKMQWLEKHRTDLKENKYWLGKMEGILFWDKDKTHVLQYENWIKNLTAADVQQTAKIMFDSKENRFVSILYPES